MDDIPRPLQRSPIWGSRACHPLHRRNGSDWRPGACPVARPLHLWLALSSAMKVHFQPRLTGLMAPV